MKLTLTSILISLLLPCTQLFAGNEYGNGGDVIYCSQQDAPPKVEILDLYEARARWGLTLDLGQDNLTPVEKVNYALERLDRIDHFRAEYYKKIAGEFFENALFISGVTLIDIPDSQFTYIPSNCEIRQIAIQKEPQFPGEKLYTISKDLWDILDNNQKAGLILHEIVYGEAISLSHSNSINSRYFMGHIASTKTGNITTQDYIKLFKLTNFWDRGTIVNSVKYFSNALELYQNGNVKSGVLYAPPGYESCTYYNNCNEIEVVTQEINGTIFNFRGYIEYFENGNVKKGILLIAKDHDANQPWKEVTYEYKTDYNCIHLITAEQQLDLEVPKSWVEFTKDGKLKHLESEQSNSILRLRSPNNNECYDVSLGYHGNSIECYKNGIARSMKMPAFYKLSLLPAFNRHIAFAEYTVVNFHNNGFVKSGYLFNDEELMTNKNVKQKFKKNEYLNFDRKGKVIVD